MQFPIDINLIRDENKARELRESQRSRFKSEGLVDLCIFLDDSWRKLLFTLNGLKAQANKLQEQVTAKMKAKEPVPDEISTQLKLVKARAKQEEPIVDELKQLLDSKLLQLGNMVHPTVPVSDNEDNNITVKQWGTLRPHQDSLHFHHEMLYMIEGFEPKQGSTVAGHRGYFLRGPGVLLNQALINYGMEFLARKGYVTLQTPYFMNKEVMSQTAQLSDFDEQLYKVVTGDEKEKDKYLIATSEQPISAFHMGESLTPEQLPKKYAGYSTNFRKEAGGYGRDVWGIFRVHQFEKIEQFVITEPDKSWAAHEEMIAIAEEFYQSLNIPYRVVNIVSGELNDAAAKKYDLEGWFPALNTYRELVSCSNCTDFQSRRLKIVYAGKGHETEKEIKFVHMLNSTLCATTRTICAIMENYQTEAGVKVPEVLQRYTGTDFLPFRRPLDPKLFSEAGGKDKGGKKPTPAPKQ
jgi:seryl-tRNA synthetase